MMCAEVIQAPVALILRVFVSSMNSAPDASVPRMKTGTCKRMRGERRVEDDATNCFFLRMSVSTGSLGTKELVRVQASRMPVNSRAHANKFICMNEMSVCNRRNKLTRRLLCPGYPLPFLKCGNGTLLP